MEEGCIPDQKFQNLDVVNTLTFGTLVGTIDLGSTNINVGLNLYLQDADANDVSADSETGMLVFGSDYDLFVYHGGTDNYIVSKSGDFIIDNQNTTGSTSFQLGTDTNATKFNILNDSGTELFSIDGSNIATFAGNINANNGVDITGANLTLADNIDIVIGTGSDLTINHNGTNTTLTSITGDFVFDNTNTSGETTFQLGTDTNTTEFNVKNNSGTNLLRVLGDGVVAFPKLTSDPGNIEGGVYYDDDENVLKFYNGSSWAELGAGAGGDSVFSTKLLVDIPDSNYTPSSTDGILSHFEGGSTYTDNITAGSGTATASLLYSFEGAVLGATNASVTTTDVSTVYIAGAPTAGTNMTITRAYSLWIGSGNFRMAESSNLMFGTNAILSDSSGTMTLSNIDALDATTEATIESAIDTLSNLTTVGALDSGSITSNFGNIDNGTSSITTTDLTANGNIILGNASTDTITFNGTIQGGSPLVFEGATENDFETTFVITDPTADRTITFPNSSIEVNASADLSGNTLASGIVSSSLTTVGALDNGSITSNFGNIDNGSSSITTTDLTANGNIILGNASTDTITLNGTIQGGSPLVFEGATENDFETTFVITDPTADRTITFPNSSIEVNASADLSGNTLASGVVSSSLTTVGALDNGSITSGFGNIDNGTSSITTTDLTANGNIILGNASTDIITFNGTIQGGSPLVFEGDFETTFVITDPTADRTITFPNSSIEVNASADLSGNTLASGVVSSSLTTVGALNSGSITSGFGNIDNGSSSITTTGQISGGSLVITGDSTFDTNTLYIDSSDNRVGIGTTSPDSQLHIVNNSDVNYASLIVESTSTGIDGDATIRVLSSNGGESEIIIGNNITDGSTYNMFHLGMVSDQTKLYFGYESGIATNITEPSIGSSTDIMVLDGANKRVGIGTISPSYKLDVDGNTNISGDLTLYYAVNDGNPTISLGSSATNRLEILSTYNSGAQTLDSVTFKTYTSSATADDGKMVFSIDESNVLEIDDDGINVTGKATFTRGIEMVWMNLDLTSNHVGNSTQIIGSAIAGSSFTLLQSSHSAWSENDGKLTLSSNFTGKWLIQFVLGVKLTTGEQRATRLRFRENTTTLMEILQNILDSSDSGDEYAAISSSQVLDLSTTTTGAYTFLFDGILGTSDVTLSTVGDTNFTFMYLG
jgi:hypothetical protein